MKQILVLLISLIFISCKNKSENADIIVNAIVIRSYDTIFENNNSKKMYDIKLSILNKSEKPITFWIMNCSWQDNFIINTNLWSFFNNGCDKNFPITKTIKPSDSLCYKATIIQNDDFPPIIYTTKFGFIYIDSLELKKYSDFYKFIEDKSKHNKIFWSNPLILK